MTLHDTGKEWVIKSAFRNDELTRPASVDVGLYNSSDALAENHDVGDITTEATGASYARQSVNIDDVDSEIDAKDNGTDWLSDFKDVTFDVSDSSETVDRYFVVISFTADDTNDSGANDHLFFTGPLGASEDLSNKSSYTLSGVGLVEDSE